MNITSRWTVPLSAVTCAAFAFTYQKNFYDLANGAFGGEYLIDKCFRVMFKFMTPVISVAGSLAVTVFPPMLLLDPRDVDKSLLEFMKVFGRTDTRLKIGLIALGAFCVKAFYDRTPKVNDQDEEEKTPLLGRVAEAVGYGGVIALAASFWYGVPGAIALYIAGSIGSKERNLKQELKDYLKRLDDRVERLDLQKCREILVKVRSLEDEEVRKYLLDMFPKDQLTKWERDYTLKFKSTEKFFIFFCQEACEMVEKQSPLVKSLKLMAQLKQKNQTELVSFIKNSETWTIQAGELKIVQKIKANSDFLNTFEAPKLLEDFLSDCEKHLLTERKDLKSSDFDKVCFLEKGLKVFQKEGGASSNYKKFMKAYKSGSREEEHRFFSEQFEQTLKGLVLEPRIKMIDNIQNSIGSLGSLKKNIPNNVLESINEKLKAFKEILDGGKDLLKIEVCKISFFGSIVELYRVEESSQALVARAKELLNKEAEVEDYEGFVDKVRLWKEYTSFGFKTIWSIGDRGSFADFAKDKYEATMQEFLKALETEGSVSKELSEKWKKLQLAFEVFVQPFSTETERLQALDEVK